MLKILFSIMGLVAASIFVVLFLPHDPVYTEWGSAYFLILTFIIIIATLYWWSWLSKTQFLVLDIEDKKKLDQKERRKNNALPVLISKIEVCALAALSVVVLTNAIVTKEYLLFSISFVGLSTTILAYFMLYGINDTHSANSVDEPGDSPLYEFINNGILLLPKKLRVGDSENLYMLFFAGEPQSTFSDIHGNTDGDQRHFRITLEGAGLKIAGKNPRSYSLKSNVLSDYWNCSFPLFGKQLINFRIDLVRERDNTVQSVFVLEHYIFVTNLLRETWKPILVIAPAIITSASILLTAFH
jgi:hypothetical protein